LLTEIAEDKKGKGLVFLQAKIRKMVLNIKLWSRWTSETVCLCRYHRYESVAHLPLVRALVRIKDYENVTEILTKHLLGTVHN